jgi:hypothetical protein
MPHIAKGYQEDQNSPSEFEGLLSLSLHYQKGNSSKEMSYWPRKSVMCFLPFLEVKRERKYSLQNLSWEERSMTGRT